MRDFILAIFLCASAASFCFAEGLSTLISVARSQGEIQKEYSEETRNFERAKENIDDGTIKKGQSKDEVRRRSGEPVIILQDSFTDREKWVYKPARSDFFKGIKIYLFFDKNGLLDEAIFVGQETLKSGR
ncbi:MAG: hypothetical protein NTW09_03735 [Candidatus Omnitrophica bacterium]|nr:hypothetical protein [Candidatus Omnitrophota bacterium]